MRTLMLIALVALTGCSESLENKVAAVEEPTDEWFDSPAADEAILRKAFMDSVGVLDPGSAQFSHVGKINREIMKTTDWCGFVRLKNRFGGYAGQSVFHVTLRKGKPYLSGLEGSDFLITRDYGCRGHKIFGS